MNDEQRQATLDGWLKNYEGLILKVVRAFAFQGHDREDLFQEIAVQLWDSIPRFKREAKLTTWIYRVALYSAMAWSRSERRDDHEPVGEESLSADEIEEDPRVSWLYEQIAGLEPVDRSLVLLLLEGLSYREMAETLGISESSVGVKIHRIKRGLAERSNQVEASDGL